MILNDIENAMMGNTQVDSIYLGTTLIWPQSLTVDLPAGNEFWYTTTDGNKIGKFETYYKNTFVSQKKDRDGKWVVTLSEPVASIPNCWFQKVNSLKAIWFPDSLTSIGNGAFEECSNLTTVTFGEKLSFIGSYAFKACNLRTINCYSQYAPTVENWDYAFDFIPQYGTVHVRKGKIAGYGNWMNEKWVYDKPGIHGKPLYHVHNFNFKNWKIVDNLREVNKENNI